MPIPYLGYARVSRIGDRAETLISPEQQAERIRSYAAARKLPLRLLEPELDVSGGKARRPILDGAIAEVERGEAAGIIVAQLDRLSRMSLIDALKTIERIEGAGGKVIAVAENFDVDTPEGRTGRNLFLVMGDMQLDRYKAQFRIAKEQAVARGIWPIPVVPRGYVKGEDRRLHPGPDKAVPISAFEQRAAGRSYPQIGLDLDLGPSSVARMLENRVYLGQIHYGEWVNLEAHEPLVSRDLFEAAQIYHPRPPRMNRDLDDPALLTGLIRCAACGYRMSVDRFSGTGLYKCRPHKATGVCSDPAIVGRRRVESVVTRSVKAHLESLTFEAVERRDRIARAEADLATAEAELAAYQEAVKVSDVGAEYFAAGMRQRVEAVEVARRELARARLASPALPAGTLEDLGEEEWRAGLRGALGVVWVRKRRSAAGIRIVAAGFEPTDFGPIDWDGPDLPGEIRVLDS